MSKKRVKKTKTKRSKFKPSRRSAPRTDIGIVSTIPFAPHSTYRDAFELGLGSSVANAGVLDNLGYDQNRLDTALGNLDGNNGIHLIVTLGGLHPALTAKWGPTVKFALRNSRVANGRNGSKPRITVPQH